MLGREDNSGNLFSLPLNLSSALAVAFLGTKGDTAAQMAQRCVPVTQEEPGFFDDLVKVSWNIAICTTLI
eukprot:bmy_21677T0